jgi:hypothetical protein
MERTNSHKKKSLQLGIDFGTATSRLKKMLLFSLVVATSGNTCCRCSGSIENYQDLSVDHVVSWLDNDPELFWDLNNIAFSHLACNSAAGRKVAANKKRGPDGKIWCSGCEDFLPVSSFHKNQRYYTGYHHYCKTCRKDKRV